MDTTEFLIELLDKLAWPVSIIILVLILRKEFAGLLENLRSLKYKDLSLEFGQRLKDAKEEAEKANLPDISKGLTMDKVEYYEELAQISPRAVVVEAWLQIESLLERAFSKQEVRYRPALIMQYAGELLRSAGLTSEEVSLFNDLRRMRNEVVHRENATLSPRVAIEYAHLAMRFVNVLSKKLKQ
jgi:hypothetical protein